MDDVVAATREREREVRADADRHADPAPARDGDGRAERDHLRIGSLEQGAASGDEVGCPRRRREHGDVVPEPSQARGEAGDVLVDVVWPRPGERRDEADAQGHRLRV